jgi:uncharacterized protein
VVADAFDAVARRHRLELILQFGSTVSGATHRLSDVDLGVLFAPGVAPLGNLDAVLQELQALFPNREVDLAVLNHADPLFLKKVTERCELLAGSPARLRQLQLYAFKRYQDHRPYLALERDYVRRHAAGRP